MLNSTLQSNSQQMLRGFGMMVASCSKRVGVLGLKPVTDNWRGNPIVELIERLPGKAFHVRIHDRKVTLAASWAQTADTF